MSKNKSNKRNKTKLKQILTTIIIIIFFMGLAYITDNTYYNNENNTNKTEIIQSYNSINEIPDYSGEIYIKINNNIPYFNENEYTTEPFERYSNLDEKGRCGVAFANICKEIMPPEGDKRGDISSVKPTGWKQEKYDGEYLYNRCHLIGYQLSDEDANEQNLITGTRYFNVKGMLPFENEVANYIEEHEENHVLYRVTPDFKEDNLLASGVEIEAYSVEDNGEGICFNVYIYNVQPGINIDYKTGKSWKN